MDDNNKTYMITTANNVIIRDWGDIGKMTIMHNELFDGPIERYLNDPNYIVEEIRPTKNPGK